MEIVQISENKKRFLDLLLTADEQEDMIDRYLEIGDMYVLYSGGAVAECVVTDEGNGVLEIKNIAVAEAYRRRGYGRALINFIAEKYSDRYSVLQAGTGDSQLTVPFYEKCGFVRTHSVKNFFADNYGHPIYECGVLLTDMIYFQRRLQPPDVSFWSDKK